MIASWLSIYSEFCHLKCVMFFVDPLCEITRRKNKWLWGKSSVIVLTEYTPVVVLWEHREHLHMLVTSNISILKESGSNVKSGIKKDKMTTNQLSSFYWKWQIVQKSFVIPLTFWTTFEILVLSFSFIYL